MIVAEKCAGIVVLASEDEIKDPMNKMPNYFGIAGDYNEGVTTSSEKLTPNNYAIIQRCTFMSWL